MIPATTHFDIILYYLYSEIKQIMILKFNKLPSPEELIAHRDKFRFYYNSGTNEWSSEEDGETSNFFLLILDKLKINSDLKKLYKRKKRRKRFINTTTAFLFSSLFDFLKDDPEDNEVAEMILSLDNDLNGVLDNFVGDNTMEWFDLIWEVISSVLTGMLDLNMSNYLTGRSFKGYDLDWLKIAEDIKQHRIFN